MMLSVPLCTGERQVEPLIVPRGARARNVKVGAAFGILTGIVVAAAFLLPAPTGTTENSPEQRLMAKAPDA